MNIHKSIATIFAVLTTSFAILTPAYALTRSETLDYVRGSCVGSTCTEKTSSTREQQNPDIAVESTQKGDEGRYTGPRSQCTTIAMNGATVIQTNVTADCVPMSISTTSDKTVITYTDGGTTTVGTCNTTKYTIDYNGLNGFEGDSWNVSTSSSTRDGSC